MFAESQLYADVGERVRSFRLERKLTQADVAAAIGLSRAAVASIEAGRQRVYLHTIFQIAEVLQVLPAALISDSTQDIEQDLGKNKSYPAGIQQYLLTFDGGDRNEEPAS